MGKQSVTYLGHTFSDKGMAPQTNKVESVVNWPQPTSQKELKQFLGLANYYRRYIQNFANIAEPLNSLLAKDIVFYWNEHAGKAFRELKKKLASNRVLICPDFTKKFVLCRMLVELDWGQFGSKKDMLWLTMQHAGD